MTDELFMRQWNAGHDQLSADLDRSFAWLRRALSHPRRGPHTIGGAYVNSHAGETPLGKAAGNLLGGLAAVGTTSALFLSVALLAIPGPASSQALSAELAAVSEIRAA
jgi:hypothetical protein